MLNENALNEIKIPFLIRELEKNDEKIKIARIAADLVTDEGVIFLDASTSAYFMIPFLTEKRNLIVITNGIKALTALTRTRAARTYGSFAQSGKYRGAEHGGVGTNRG